MTDNHPALPQLGTIILGFGKMVVPLFSIKLLMPQASTCYCSMINPYFTAMFYAFNGYVPVVHPSSFVHPQAAVTGHVVIGRNCYIGPGAALRGDWGAILLEDGCNVQENCTIHMFPGVQVLLQSGSHIGHGAIIHGAQIGRDCLIGMNAVIMDRVVLEEECIVGALTLVKEGMHVPRRSLVAGQPGKIIREVGDEMMAWKKQGTAWYQQLPADMAATWKPCEPLTEVPEGSKLQQGGYNHWSTEKAQGRL